MKSEQFLLITSVLLFSLAGAPAAAEVAFFGEGAPSSAAELPPGDLRQSIESLSPDVRGRTLQWLQSIEFSGQDLPYLKVDAGGGVYYADTFDKGREPAQQPRKPVASGQVVNAKTVFRLHSYPGAPHTLFLDFDGGEVRGTVWNDNARVSSWKVKPYDTDNKPRSFSIAEISEMAEIWQRVAEDFAPFNIDVTTEDPGKLGPNIGWILVTDSAQGSAASLPDSRADGVAYVNTYGYGQTARYSPAFVYYNNLGSVAAVAEACSHQMGHILGLTHDAVSTAGASAGNGSGAVSWAPIMSVSHNRHVTQWSKGEYRGATNTQDDIAILFGRLGLRGDDHEDSRYGTGTALIVDAQGRVNASNPETDPDNRHTENKGVIEDRDDVDVFVFKAGAGTVDITVTPAWGAYSRGDHRGANLDVYVALYNASGKRIAEHDPRDDTVARLRTRVPGGRYTLEVKGVGNSEARYSDYGSLGQYFITGTVPPRSGGSVALSDKR